ncbi:Eco57I restriction-modification methylase domain-containing protein [Ralstonia pseudosolanacearum]|uniref:Eco57I restriction-modification methylase domain-containing protein n=1 Tax=Burkholderiaceae TaxID=119060 RepID=UPI00163E4978|nr:MULTISPECIES: N-6 DNA methylase [Burkholderia]QTO48331.1 N-6 DNA methylase [Burkholderia latens]
MPALKKTTARATAARANSGRFTDLDEDKLRGGYYTSGEVASWLCAWAIRSTKDRVLEPSCGDGAFLRAAAQRYADLGLQSSSIAQRMTGVEIISDEANRARESLREALGSHASKVVETSDFFTWWNSNAESSFDAVIGNPPFIRYQTFPEPHRSLAMALMAEEGLSPNRLTNIWVPFVVAAVTALRPGGRLGLVLPAELLQVTYAAQLRSFLTDRFDRIDIVACNELFFKKAEQEVVLLLADGLLKTASETNPCRVTMTEAHTVGEITARSPEEVLASAQPKTIRHDSEKWLKYFLTEHEISFMRELRASDATASLSKHASVDVGVVTGKNEFFVLTSEQVKEIGLNGYTAPLISRSMHLKGALVGKSDWQTMAASGDRVHLLDLKPIRGNKLSAALRRYIEHGEAQQVHTGYKCSIRDPWYEVPSVWTPDGFLFRQIYDFPRVVLNEAEATSTDTIHRLTAKEQSPERVIANTYSWLTAASAEIEGRSYGGGVLELEPTEAERLLMPATLNGAIPLSDCDRLTREGRLDEVLEENARIVLMDHMGLSRAECLLLRDIWVKMRNRRMARRKSARATKRGE